VLGTPPLSDWNLRLLGLMLLASALASGCGVASHGLNTEGVRMYQQGNYDGAMKRFGQAVANNPKNADSFYNLAATYHQLGKRSGNQAELRQAENFNNQCLDHDDNHAECYRGLAVLLAETGRRDASFRLLEGWNARRPASPDAKIELARLLDESGEKEQARNNLLSALSVDPNHPRALTALGQMREEAGEHLQALANYERSLSVNRFQPQVATRVAALQGSYGGSTNLAPPGETRVVNEPTQWKRY
jgi:tetratricopeptide (TPR) repeat protein